MLKKISHSGWNSWEKKIAASIAKKQSTAPAGVDRLMYECFKGALVEIAAILSIFLLLWYVRPIFFPRLGMWNGDDYFVRSVYCGSVYGIRSFNGNGTVTEYFDGDSIPPLWVGPGNAERYQTKTAAQKAVESECR